MLITKADLDDLKARLDIVEVIGRHVALKPQGKYLVGRCPFHAPDKTPSLVVDPKARLWNCLGACRANGNAGGGKGSSGGDVLSFLMKITGKGLRELAKENGVDVKDDPPAPRPRNGNGSNAPNGSHATNGSNPASPGKPHLTLVEGRAPRTAYLGRVVDLWQKELAINRGGQEALEARGLLTRELWRAYRVGFSSGSIEDLSGGEESEARRWLLELGILGAEGREAMKNRLVFPLLALNQLPVGVYGRAIKARHEPKHLFLAGPRRGLFNWNAVRRSKEVLLVESVLCALSLAEAGIPHAIPLCGLSVPEELWDLVERFGVTGVVLGLDADEAGRKAVPVLSEAFAKKGVAVRAIEWPAKDPNDLLVEKGPKVLKDTFEKLVALPRTCDVVPLRLQTPMTTTAAAAVGDAVTASDSATVSEAVIPSLIATSSPEAAAVASSEAVVDAVREESSAESRAETSAVSAAAELTLTFEDRLWDVLWLDSPSPAHLRARVKVFVGHRPPSPPTFLDHLNLLSSRAREGFARKAASLALPLDAPASDEKRLLRLLDEELIRIAQLGEERKKTTATKEDKPGVMTPERRRRALAYLSSLHLLARVAEDIRVAGYVGEATVKLLGYLVAVSRKLPESLSMVILSSSGSGKSALADVLEKLTPEEDLMVVTRFTASSLYWLGKDAMKRKFVSIEERSGSQEADYSIRALQSKRKVTMMAPIKDQATGKIETKLFEVEGPVSFLESTTESQIHHENATRCFEVRLDETVEQTRRIQDAQRWSKTFEGQRAKVAAQEIAALHQDVQRLLRPVPVVIPYASAIEFPSDSIRTRRDNPRFLNLVEALAFLHQYQRPLTVFATGEPCDRLLEDLPDDELSDVRVEATLDDYAAAYELASDLLYETLSEIKKPVRVFFEAVRRLVAEEAGKRDLGTDPAETGSVSVLTREIRHATNLPQHVVKRWLAELVEMEYLAVTRGARGSAAAYRLVDLPEKEGRRIPGLLLPEDLARKLAERSARPVNPGMLGPREIRA